MKIKNLLVAVLVLIGSVFSTSAQKQAPAVPSRLPLSSIEDLWIAGMGQVRHIYVWVTAPSLVYADSSANGIGVDYTPGPGGASPAEIQSLIQNLQLRIETADPTETIALHIQMSGDNSSLFTGDGSVTLVQRPDGKWYVSGWSIGWLTISDSFTLSFPGAQYARWIQKDEYGNVVATHFLLASDNGITIPTGLVSNPDFLAGELIVGSQDSYGNTLEYAYRLSDGREISAIVVAFNPNAPSLIKGFVQWPVQNPTGVQFQVQEWQSQFVGELNFTQATVSLIFPSSGMRDTAVATYAQVGKIVSMVTGDEYPFYTDFSNPFKFEFAPGNYLIKLDTWNDQSFGIYYRESHPVADDPKG